MAEPLFYFVSDLHGRAQRYQALLAEIRREPPQAVFLGGDLFSPRVRPEWFLDDFLFPQLRSLQKDLGARYPYIFAIMGNDDEGRLEPAMRQGENDGVWFYAHGRRFTLDSLHIYGYACTPPSPFRLKDWERYDVSRYADPGCLPPEEGIRTIPVGEYERHYATIAAELEVLAPQPAAAEEIFLFHAPPYGTALDRADLDGRTVDHAPLDVHVGSIAIRRFIENRQPLLTLHGHVHEAPRLSGTWRGRLGRTHIFSAAHDGPELALVRFSPVDPASAERRLV